MPTSLEQKIYLRALAGTPISTRYSRGSRRRAAQVQRFLQTLSEAASAAPTPLKTTPLNLTILSRRDWKFSYPYGFPFAVGPGSSGAGGAQVVAAAAYPERFLRRFDDVLVRAARAGFKAPGDLREYLDLTLGLEWGHAVLRLNGLASEKWLDELLATHLFFLSLREARLEGVAQRFSAWSELLRRGSGVDQLALSAFVYPRGKARLGDALFFQGKIARKAAELLQPRTRDEAWATLREAQLKGSGAKKQDRSDALRRSWPELEPWLSSFSDESS